MLNNFNLFTGLNINPIPLEFSNSLTTVEFLGALQKKLNELITECNKAFKDIDTSHDKKLELLKVELFNSLNVMKQEIEEINTNYDKIAELEKEFQKIQKTFTEIQKTVTTLNADTKSLRSLIDIKINELKKYIEETPTVVYSPVSGELMNISKAVREIVEVHKNFYGLNWFYLRAILSGNNEGVSATVTYDSWLTHLKTLNKNNNWYALSFYGVEFWKNSLKRTNGTMANIPRTPALITTTNHNQYDTMKGA